MILPQRKPPLAEKRDPCLYLSNDQDNGETSKRYQESAPPQLPKKEGGQGHDGQAVLQASLQVTARLKLAALRPNLQGCILEALQI